MKKHWSILTVTIFCTVPLVLLLCRRNCGVTIPDYLAATDRKGCEKAVRQITSSAIMRTDNGPPRLPLKNVTYSLEEIIHKEWYRSIEDFLSRLSSKTIVLLSASEDFLPILFNWLSSYRANALSSLSEVLVLAMDEAVHKKLLDKHFNSVFISDKDIFLPNTKLVTPFSHIWIKRCTVARILNHLGYDIMMFDLDAVVLKDIASLLTDNSSSDIVGSIGKYPFDLGHKWGFTLCMGVVTFRSTQGTETFWNAVSDLDNKKEDDQIRTNQALNSLHINWTKDTKCQRGPNSKPLSAYECTVHGKTNASTGEADQLRVTLLSRDIVCRSCNRLMRTKYYVWHNHSSRTKEGKEKVARKGHVWFLRDNWESIFEQSSYKGFQLIDQMTKQSRRHANKRNSFQSQLVPYEQNNYRQPMY